MRSLVQHFATGSLFMYGLKLWTGRLETGLTGRRRTRRWACSLATVDVATLVLFQKRRLPDVSGRSG